MSVSTGYVSTSNTSSGYHTQIQLSKAMRWSESGQRFEPSRCNLHLSTLPCAWCEYEAREIFQTKCLNDLNKTVSDELSKVFSQQEEPLADNIDRTLLAKLEGMRAARDEAVRYAQTLNDEAALHRIEDERLRAQATRIIDQVNEGTPVPEDS